MAWEVSAKPTIYPITLDELKDQLKIETTDEDTYLEEVRKAAASRVEAYLDRPLMVQTIRQYWDKFPAGRELALIFDNGVVFTDLKYFADTATSFDEGDYTTFNSSKYTENFAGNMPCLQLVPNECWPSTADVKNAVRAEFKIGYSVGDVPADIKRATLLIAADFYCIREDSARTMPQASQNILDFYKDRRF